MELELETLHGPRVSFVATSVLPLSLATQQLRVVWLQTGTPKEDININRKTANIGLYVPQN